MKHDIEFFDFLRGWAALIVFVSHATILGYGSNILYHLESVNAFMFASGFLIYLQCSIGKSYHKLQNIIGLKNFYIRRFFRIAPAYYFCLIISLIFSDYLGLCREAIAEILPNSMTNMDRYFIEDPIKSFFIHISFIFGVLPSYSYSTPLPDWSLGLEMQFYLIFPLLFFYLRKNILPFLIISLSGMLLIWFVSNSVGYRFPMPSYLPLKFHNFAAGIALAHLYLNKNNISKSHYSIILFTLLFLFIGNRTIQIPLLFLFGWWWICNLNIPRTYNTILIEKIFKCKLSKYLADRSYSIYIFHLVIMLPFFAFVLEGGRLKFSEWLFATLILLILTLGVAEFIYKYIETPGISLGKKLINRYVI